jgi:uncharacterized protein (TIGR01777 family)
MKKILITGASGFVGKYLAEHLVMGKHQVIGIGTSLGHPWEGRFDNFKWISADTSRKGDWQNHVAASDIVINLTGRNIFKPWTKSYKQSIYDSRIFTTRHIVDAMEKGKPAKLLNASAIGYYGDMGETLLSETDSPGSDFLAEVCRDWETQALTAEKKGVNVCIMRFGVVLGAQGALAKMAPVFKCFVGGPLGNGRQWFPWIHIKDLYTAVEFLIEDQDVSGIFNFTGPSPVRQKDFAKALGRALKRPAFMPAPAFLIRLLMGELGSSLMQSQKAFPGKLVEKGFEFEFQDIVAALEDIFKK